MVQTIKAEDINLFDLKKKFGLERADDPQFFSEWQEDLPDISDFEKQALDEVKADYLHLSKYTIQEAIVKLVVLSPLLRLAGFYRPPFYLAAEKEVRISSRDNGFIVSGRLDLLIFNPDFWIMVIEAKKAQYSLEAGIPQALAYMLGSPDKKKPAFGFVTNGPYFQFLKLTRQGTPKYALSNSFYFYNNNDLYVVLKVLKRLGQLVVQ